MSDIESVIDPDQVDGYIESDMISLQVYDSALTNNDAITIANLLSFTCRRVGVPTPPEDVPIGAEPFLGGHFRVGKMRIEGSITTDNLVYRACWFTLEATGDTNDVAPELRRLARLVHDFAGEND